LLFDELPEHYEAVLNVKKEKTPQILRGFAPPVVKISKQFIEDLHILWKLEPSFQNIVNKVVG
jgi:hypothetical protein